MVLKKWEMLPPEMQNDEVRKYYDILAKKRGGLILKRIFDIVVSAVMLVVLLPFFVILAIAIKLDSKGPVFYRQVRVTQYNKKFRIFKFRSMVQGADKGAQVTVGGDTRVTRVGKIVRKCRLDEITDFPAVANAAKQIVHQKQHHHKGFRNCQKIRLHNDCSGYKQRHHHKKQP